MKHETERGRRCRRRWTAALACFAILAALAPGGRALGAAEPGEAVPAFGVRELLGWLTGAGEAPPAAAQPRVLIPVGHTVGIKLFSDGVLVVGLGQVDTASGAAAPAKACGLREGDIITHINAREVDTIEEVQSILAESSGAPVSIRALRGEDPIEMTTQAVQCTADGAYKLGAWIRDSMAGIGTVTFYDPETGTFGALGHGVSDVDTQRLMPLSAGAILHSAVAGVEKGQVGRPGQLKGAFDVDADLGALYANTPSGIFGTVTDPGALPLGEALPVAGRREVHLGEVTIRSNIRGEEVEEYTAQITRIYPEDPGDGRSFLLKITDPRLLERTGGIVQGMVVRYNRDNTGKP